MIVDGHEVIDATGELLRRTGSLKPNMEFKRWLHIWTHSTENSRGDDVGHISRHTAFPWVQLWDKPDLSEMMATYFVTDFVNFPSSWEQFWYDLDDCIEERRASMPSTAQYRVDMPWEIRGPFWMLSDVPSVSRLAAEMSAMKRRVLTEMFNRGRRALVSDENLKFHRQLFYQALEPFRVMSPQQELEDETARVTEERRDALRIRDRAASGRPPRCR